MSASKAASTLAVVSILVIMSKLCGAMRKGPTMMAFQSGRRLFLAESQRTNVLRTFTGTITARPPMTQSTSIRRFASVTGNVYKAENEDAPSIVLFTKEGCTLCDKVKDVLKEAADDDAYVHSLDQVDITDVGHEEWFDKYKYDIPVLHLNGEYWAKHRLDVGAVHKTFDALRDGTYQSPPKGEEPNAAEMERKRN